MIRGWFALGAWLLVLGLAGSPPRATAADLPARIRVIHAAPDAPPVDVRIDDQVVLSDTQFPAISDYVDVSAGAHTIAVTPKGQDASAAIIQTQGDFEAGAAYTVAAVGLANISAEIYRDDLTAPAAGQARVRIIHTSPDAPGADVEVVDGPTLVQNLAFTEASPYLDLPADTYNLRLVIAADNTVVVPLPNTTLQAGTIYDVVATGRLANIQIIVGTFTPSQSTAAATTPMMPNTGVRSSQSMLLMLALLALLGGLIMRHGTMRWSRLAIDAAHGSMRRRRGRF